jgi:phage terminase Nu1 subunit (DNA packaging protein)
VNYTYREAADRVERSVRTINRWRRSGMPMSWEIRDGQRVRVVAEDTLLKWYRSRLAAWPPHRYRMRRIVNADDAPKTRVA